MIMCYKNMCHFMATQKHTHPSLQNPDFLWESQPTTIVYHLDEIKKIQLPVL